MSVPLPLSVSCDLLHRNTLALRARARQVLPISRLEQVATLGDIAASTGLFILGGGSNVVLPETFDATVALVRLEGIRVVDMRDETVVIEAAAGENWHRFVAHCIGQGFGGLENLALIPGTVGAAPVQNIGAYGLEVSERIQLVTAYDMAQGRWRRLSAADCEFSYRDSLFKRAQPGRWLIASVQFALPRRWCARLDYPDLRKHPAWQHEQPTPRRVFEAICEIRRNKLPDPASLPNAGSFFKNPVVAADAYAALAQRHCDLPGWRQEDGRVKLAAAWLIDQCGWKGRRMGTMGVHARHALVLVNHGGSTARDVARLAGAIQKDVHDRYGVWLEPEPVAPQGALAYAPPVPAADGGRS